MIAVTTLKPLTREGKVINIGTVLELEDHEQAQSLIDRGIVKKWGKKKQDEAGETK